MILIYVQDFIELYEGTQWNGNLLSEVRHHYFVLFINVTGGYWSQLWNQSLKWSYSFSHVIVTLELITHSLSQPLHSVYRTWINLQGNWGIIISPYLIWYDCTLNADKKSIISPWYQSGDYRPHDKSLFICLFFFFTRAGLVKRDCFVKRKSCIHSSMIRNKKWNRVTHWWTHYNPLRHCVV